MSCKCEPGYFGNGFSCSLINPCKENNCDSNAECTPFKKVTDESDYNCECNQGFSGNGFVCTENIDPCALVACAQNAQSKIENSIYGIKSCSCECENGFIGDGYNRLISTNFFLISVIREKRIVSRDRQTEKFRWTRE